MTPLEEILRQKIVESGPIPVAEYMRLALAHPDHGYYRRGDPLGTAGDFITAPEISQVFGELIGLWAAVTWQQMGSPRPVLLAECGPGRGTLMADALRAAAMAPAFAEAAEIHLVETSPALRARQRETLSEVDVAWHDDVAGLPDAPLIVIANEFFDALPVRQLVRTAAGWAERCVGLAEGALAFVVDGPCADGEAPPGDAGCGEAGAIFETSPAAQAAIAEIARRLARTGGAALVVDYGHARTACGETLQAVRRHAYADPLADPGAADLTAHVDFDALGRSARAAGAATFGPVTQRQFLMALGILQRTERLTRDAPPAKADAILAATNRLIDARDMGTLFKALAVVPTDAPPPAGFETT